MSLESEVTLSLSLASSSGPRDTPASRVDPLEPMLQGRLRNTSAPMPHQPLNATSLKRYCRAGRESTRKKGDVRDKEPRLFYLSQRGDGVDLVFICQDAVGDVSHGQTHGP